MGLELDSKLQKIDVFHFVLHKILDMNFLNVSCAWNRDE